MVGEDVFQDVGRRQADDRLFPPVGVDDDVVKVVLDRGDRFAGELFQRLIVKFVHQPFHGSRPFHPFEVGIVHRGVMEADPLLQFLEGLVEMLSVQ